MRHLKTGKYFSWSFSNHLRAYCRQGIGRSKNIGIRVPACSRTHRLFEERWSLCIELLHNVMLDLWKWRWDAGTYCLVPAPWAEIRVTWDQDLAASPGNTARLCLFLKLKRLLVVHRLRTVSSHMDETVNMAVGRTITFPEIGQKRSRVIKAWARGCFSSGHLIAKLGAVLWHWIEPGSYPDSVSFKKETEN